MIGVYRHFILEVFCTCVNPCNAFTIQCQKSTYLIKYAFANRNIFKLPEEALHPVDNGTEAGYV